MAGRGDGAGMKRRGLIAGAAALVAGIVAERAAQPVGATHQPEDLGLGITNTATGVATRLSYSGTGLPSQAILIVEDNGFEPTSSHLAALAGFAMIDPGNVNIGVYGATLSRAADNAGVLGEHVLNGTGVRGLAGTNGTAVYGECYGSANSHGVWGNADQGKGVFGQAIDARGTGVYGVSGGSGAAGNGNGVYGVVNHVGSTQVTAGVFGDSTASYGIIGRTTAVSYSGCTGIADGAGRAAFAGSGTNGAYGAYFTGPTVVAGDFTVVSGQKHAAVAHPDGSYRLLHCVESPEPWFEDFGEAKLVNGKAEVKLDPDFAAVVDTSAYHVFLTEIGGHSHLAVMGKTAAAFVVQSEKTGASGAFAYRMVAKRKDISAARMAKFDLPKIKLPKPEEMPPPPQPPKKP